MAAVPLLVALVAVVAVVGVVGDARSHSNQQAGDTPMEEECRGASPLPLEVELNNGVKIPRIGFGTAGLGGATEASVLEALAAGYRHIDTAQAAEWYAEDDVGRALRRAIAGSSSSVEGSSEASSERKSDGSSKASWTEAVPREEIFVTTKVHPRNFHPGLIAPTFRNSKDILQGVDLLLLHSPRCWPGGCPENPTSWQDAWRELERFYSEGAVRAIGVSNFSANELRELLEMAVVTPAAVQNWMDPFHQDREVRAVCAENGIAYVAYSTLGGQWLYRASAAGTNPVMTDVTLGRIAEKHGASRQAVALSWALQSDAIILPRSSNPDNIRENVQGFVMWVDPGCKKGLLLNGGIDPSSSCYSSLSASSCGEGDGGEASSATVGVGAGECEDDEVHGGSGAATRYGRSSVTVMLTADDMVEIDHLDGVLDRK